MEITHIRDHSAKEGFVGCEIKVCRNEATYIFENDGKRIHLCDKHSVFFGGGKIIMSD
jgi:hypothetical protein